MQLELTKVLVKAVVAEREDGHTVGERVTEEFTFYTEEQLAVFMPGLQAEIVEENARLAELDKLNDMLEEETA